MAKKLIFPIKCLKCKNKAEKRRSIQWCSCLRTPASLPIKGKWSDPGTQPNTFAIMMPIHTHALRSQLIEHKWLIEWSSGPFLPLPWTHKEMAFPKFPKIRELLAGQSHMYLPMGYWLIPRLAAFSPQRLPSLLAKSDISAPLSRLETKLLINQVLGVRSMEQHVGRWRLGGVHKISTMGGSF